MNMTLRLVLAGLIVLTIALLAGCATSPTGRQQVMLVPQSKMAQLGQQSFAEMRKQGKFANAPKERAYASCVAHALIDVLPAQWRNQKWDVQIIKDNSANAFALPGGRIGVNQGMFKVATSQAQLATVLGHELAHVVARHGAERVSDNMLVQSGVAAASAYGASKGGNSKQIMAALGAGAEVGILLPFSRTQEAEADTLGQRYMARAGFDPEAAVTLWKKMENQGGSRPPAFLSTHPAPAKRIQSLSKQAQQLEAVYKQARKNGHTPDCHM